MATTQRASKPKALPVKPLIVLYRVALKKYPGVTVYVVKSSDGEAEYQVSLLDGKVSGCSCRERFGDQRQGIVCYHMKGIQRIEDARAKIAEPKQEKPVPPSQKGVLSSNTGFSLLK